MIETQKGESFAIIIAIEDYRFSDKENGIVSVKYAKNDAIKFKKLLQDDFGLNENNITFWIDRDANKSAFENELKYKIRQLTPEDRLYFYFAGHGFYQNGNSRLTCWDTHPDNLFGTTVSIKEILLDSLEESKCEQNLIFLDCCSTFLSETITGRDLISNFKTNELESFFAKTNKYTAIFMSCSPGEKSYPHEVLKNGIWTWHLIEALKGNAPEALIDGQFITDNSLKNYLSFSVPKFITEQTKYSDTQKPYAKIGASSDFLIRKVEKIDSEANQEFPQIQIDYTSSTFRKLESIDVRNATGFKGTHYVPDAVNSATRNFVQSIFEQEIVDDVQKVYENSKSILSLRKKQINYNALIGSGFVENEYFRYSVTINQDSDNPTYAILTRKLQIRVGRNQLPTNFDNIFPFQINEITFSYDEEIKFEDLVEKFENLQEKEGGDLTDNEIKGVIDYQTYNGISIKINTKTKKILIQPKRRMKTLELIDLSSEELKKISKNEVKILK